MRLVCGFALLGFCFAAPAAASETATATVMVHVDVCSRTSLRVSSDMLRFTVSEDQAIATAAVDFRAAARVPPGVDLVLTVEPMPDRLPSQGDGAVTLNTGPTLTAFEPSVAARWQGSGIRSGRLIFTLHGATPGAHELPVRFVLTTP